MITVANIKRSTKTPRCNTCLTTKHLKYVPSLASKVRFAYLCPEHFKPLNRNRKYPA